MRCALVSIALVRSLSGFGSARKNHVHFETLENCYVAFGDNNDIAGMDNFAKIIGKTAPGKQ